MLIVADVDIVILRAIIAVPTTPCRLAAALA